ncbi:uncharacterized protein LOC129756712 isoform X1 [Uranotaenia lowii]|uniref:uncharacterized protein LOC129756712 isoform X1 n=1 Tax=Uranotaenia lowii TaxID=190385 RepID=UPI00247B0B46|nr:uncharacterized protein LOC129756712 isoform X1 [Uranotaenia lowii]
MAKITLVVALAVALCICESRAQSNYASHANSIEYQGDGLPEEATLDGKVTKLDDLSPIIFLNRTKAALNCAAGSMLVDLKFNEKFYGTVYANFDRSSVCQITGKGQMTYSIELPLKGCGTKQEPQRVFTNNIVVRFHPGLEMDGDEIITIVCRYPPPEAPIPAGLPAPILTDIIPASLEPPLKGIQIIFIICAIMFLTLLLIGLGVSYYCLRRQPMPIVRRVVHVGSGSEITALETGSIGSISGLKLPHAHVALHQTQSISGSDGPLIPSDYPSESHSENEEVDTGSLPVSSHGSYENNAFIQDASSIYSEHYGFTQEIRNVAACEASPKFDIHVRVKRTPPPLPSPLTSDSESNTTVSRNERNNLSTIMESHEDARSDSVLTVESLQEAGHTQFTYTPELHTVPKHIQPAPIVSKISKNHQKHILRDTWPENYPDGHQVSSTRSIVSLGTEMTDTHSMTEILDSSHLYPHSTYSDVVDLHQTDDLPEPQISVVKRNQISSHIVDDVFMQTVTEKTTIEDVERHKRMVTEYKAKPVVDPNWDVTIRNYRENNEPEWEDFSDISSASGMTIPRVAPIHMAVPTSTYISENAVMLQSPELVGNMKPIDIPPEDKTVSNWDVLIRVLQEVEMPDTAVSTASLQNNRVAVPLVHSLSYDDKIKWKEIITTESTLRTMLTEAVVREDFEKIRSDARYEKLFEPQSWEIIMRILAPPDDVELRRSKRKKRETWDTRSRRSSLPTLYEYDSDGGSSVRTITQDPIIVTTQNRESYSSSSRPRSRKTSRSSYSSNNVDYRSMTEVMVDFAKPKYPDSYSDGSSYSAQQYFEDDQFEHRSMQRSSSHPSLARSASEFTERWVAPDEMDSSTPEPSPHMARRERNVMVEANVSDVGGNHHIIRESQTQYIETRQTNYRVASDRNNEW